MVRLSAPLPHTRLRSQVTAVLSLFGSDCRALRPLLATIDASSGEAPHASKGLSPNSSKEDSGFLHVATASIVMHGAH